MGVGTKLQAHLAALRAYFLLGSGDLLQAFLLEARWQVLCHVFGCCIPTVLKGVIVLCHLT